MMPADFAIKESTETHTSHLFFCMKVYRILSATVDSPGAVTRMGAIWTRDGVHFVTHCSTLAVHLGLKRNSVNANFRIRCFTNDPVTKAQLLEMVPDLANVRGINPKKWRLRMHRSSRFTAWMTPADAEALDVEARSLGSRMAPSQISAAYDPPVTEWSSRFGSHASALSVAVLEALVPAKNGDSNERIAQLRLNCLRMLA
jgi:hypothetical protein